MAWIGNQIKSYIWDAITHPCYNLSTQLQLGQGSAGKVWASISNYIKLSYMDVITDPVATLANICL